MMENVAILLVLYNDTQHLKRLVDSIEQQKNIKYTVFAIDCHEEQQSLHYLKSRIPSTISYAYQGNLGYAKGNNLLAQKAYDLGFYNAVICNTDVILHDMCLYRLSKYISEGYTVSSPLLYYGTPLKTKGLHSYAERLNFKTYKTHTINQRDTNIDYLKDIEPVNIFTGCLFMFNIHSFIECGMFYEEGFMYGEEIDLAIKLHNKEFTSICVKNAVAWHNHTEKSSNIMYDQSYYYIKRNFILTCKRYGNNYALWTTLAKDISLFPIKLILSIKRNDIKGLKFFYKGIYDGLKNIKGKIL